MVKYSKAYRFDGLCGALGLGLRISMFRSGFFNRD